MSTVIYLLSCGLLPLLSYIASRLAPCRHGRAKALQEFHKNFQGIGHYTFRIDWRFCHEDSVRWFDGYYISKDAATNRAAELAYNSKIIQGVAIYNEYDYIIDYITPKTKPQQL